MTRTRGLFSERFGFTSPKGLQVESIDGPLKNELWNCVNFFLDKRFPGGGGSSTLENCYIGICIDFFEIRTDTAPGSYRTHEQQIQHISSWFFGSIGLVDWYHIYDFLDFVIPYIEDEEFPTAINLILEKHKAAYRLANKKITPITDENETLAIEEVAKSEDVENEVKEHLQTAQEKLSDRKSPDYRNSMSESVKAVESKARFILNDPKITLGKALKKIDMSEPFFRVFSTFYGSTSNSGGIRHSLTDDKYRPTFHDAKLTFVMCVSFIHYLTGLQANTSQQQAPPPHDEQ